VDDDGPNGRDLWTTSLTASAPFGSLERISLEESDAMSDPSTIVYEGGPRHGDTDSVDRLAAVLGSGRDGGMYQRTDEERDGLVVYRWQVMSEAELSAIIRGDLRANQ
jgi:hypothetical protein